MYDVSVRGIEEKICYSMKENKWEWKKKIKRQNFKQ